MKKLWYFFVFSLIFVFSCKGPDEPVPPVDTSAKTEFKATPASATFGNFTTERVAIADPPGQTNYYVWHEYLYFLSGANKTLIEELPNIDRIFIFGLGDVCAIIYEKGKVCSAYARATKKPVYLPVSKFRFHDARFKDQKIIFELVDSLFYTKDNPGFSVVDKSYGRFDTATGILTMDK
jgi:hypothetical protein